MNIVSVRHASGIAILLLASLGSPAQDLLKAHVVLTRNGHALKDASNVVVWLNPLGEAVTPRQQKPTEIPKLVQRNKSFHPALIVIPVGGKVEFPNRDPFFHNVFSLFEGKRFDLGLYEGGSTRFVQFDKPGISYIFCNIHAEMNAVVVALATPYYAISDTRGEITFPNVPAGRYQMKVFNSRVSADDLRALEREVRVVPGETSLGGFSLNESDVLLAHKNKYGRGYDPPEPDSPAYVHP